MKVVLFCGGLGTRLREHSDTVPKPLVSIGHRPIVTSQPGMTLAMISAISRMR
jgi:NDP-sugar pyrophosphorylase family protein